MIGHVDARRMSFPHCRIKPCSSLHCRSWSTWVMCWLAVCSPDLLFAWLLRIHTCSQLFFHVSFHPSQSENEPFDQWFLLYSPSVRPLLLLMDGHWSHYCHNTIAQQQIHVVLITLPPNTTHNTVKHLYFAGLNFRNFCEFEATCENISTKILTLHTIACFYSKFFQQNCQKQQFAKI